MKRPIDPKLLKAIEEIAKKHLHVETLEARHRDSLDFYDCSVWGMSAALLAAYELGRASKK